MKRDEVKKDIESRYGVFVNLTQIAEFLGTPKGRDKAREMMADVAHIGKNPKKYYSGDIADKIMAMRAM